MESDAAILTLAATFIGGVIVYFAALGTARRQRRHEVRERTYSVIVPLIQDLIDMIGWIHDSQELDLADDEHIAGHLVRLVVGAFAIGDTDAVLDIDDMVGDFNGTTKKAKQELVGAVRSRVLSSLLPAQYRVGRDFRHASEALVFTPPTPPVKQKIDELLGMLAADQNNFAMRSLVKSSGLAGMLPSVDLAARAQAYTKILNELKAAISGELKHTLRWR